MCKLSAWCFNSWIVGAWDGKRNVKPRVWLVSSPCGGPTLLAEHRSDKKTESLSSFKHSCRNVECDVENKGVGGREETNFFPQVPSKAKSSQNLGFFLDGWVYMEWSTVLDSFQVAGGTTHEVGKGVPQLERMLHVPPSLAPCGVTSCQGHWILVLGHHEHQRMQNHKITEQWNHWMVWVGTEGILKII